MTNLLESLSAEQYTSSDDSGRTTRYRRYTASRAHFQVLMCNLAGVNAEEHLMKFRDIKGQPIYAKEIKEVMNDCGTSRGIVSWETNRTS